MIRFYPGSNNPNMHSRGMTALTGNGLGGTSLINANIAIEPDSELFSFTESIFSGKRGIASNQRVWPEAYSHENLQTYYNRAKDTLGVIKLKEYLMILKPLNIKKSFGESIKETSKSINTKYYLIL
ncbi:MAG: hypothetical protein R3B45_16765 [Bdellovibrionota bacterium]